jgi:signal transduction histidine kinase
VQFRGVWLSEVFAIITMQVALLALIGHLFGVWELYGSISSARGTGMAVHTAVGYLLLGAGLLCARADRGLMSVLRSDTPGGTMARRWTLIPPLVLLWMGVVYLAINQSGHVDQAISSWALFMTSLLVLTVAVWTTAEALHQTGLMKDGAQRTLEERVRERTAELNQANDALNAAKEELARANERLEHTVQERTRHLNDTIASLETVCYNIAHDLRAPNRAVAGYAQVLLQQYAAQLDDTAQQYLRRIVAAAQLSDALTLDLLAYGRLGHVELPCSQQCLRTCVEDVLQKLAGEIEVGQATVDVQEPLPHVWANPNMLEQVLTNLITNAMKFVAEGVRPHITIRAEDAGSFCRVLVVDNGIGVPLEHQQSIFGVFHRLHPAQKQQGTGIGLAIVKKSVERMGGKVGVISTFGEGSSFWFELQKA